MSNSVLVESDSVLVERDGGVAVVTLNRPRVKNAISFAMWDELSSVFSGFIHDESVRSIVLRGEGGNFSAGTDLRDLRLSAGKPAEERALGSMQRMRVVADVVTMMDAAPQPIVCAVSGVAIGGGMGLALAGDLVVGADDAWFKVGTVALGSMPDVAVPLQLYRSIGLRKTKQICMLDEKLTMHEALDFGLVNWVVDPHQVDQFALEVAHRLAATPGHLQSRIKSALNALPDRSLTEHLHHEILDVGDCVRESVFVDVMNEVIKP